MSKRSSSSCKPPNDPIVSVVRPSRANRRAGVTMSAIKGFAARLRALFAPRATERSLNEEIEFHIEQETAKNLRLGLSRAEARRRALVEFGGLTQAREAHHDV